MGERRKEGSYELPDRELLGIQMVPKGQSKGKAVWEVVETQVSPSRLRGCRTGEQSTVGMSIPTNEMPTLSSEHEWHRAGQEPVNTLVPSER